MYTPKGTRISWRRRERANVTSPWQFFTNEYSARYQLVDIASRLAGDEVYLAGILPDGKSVIEKCCIVKPSIELHALTAVPKPDVLFLVDGNNDAIFEQVQSIPLVDDLATLDAESNQPYPWSWPWKDS